MSAAANLPAGGREQGARAERLADLAPPDAGPRMRKLMAELLPWCRSVTGDGLRATLRALARLVPLELHEVRSGTRLFDWTVPDEWNVRGARLIGPDGAVVADFARSNLHLVGYSPPFRGRLALADLQRHLHSIPERPSWIPFRTSWPAPEWGFCLSHEQRRALVPGEYEVFIDTSLEPGALTYGECVLSGSSEGFVLLSAHCCHPSLANDNLSGVVLAATLASLLRPRRLRLSYRFLFAPGTIGSLAWLAANEALLSRMAGGLVLACLGDDGPLNYKRTRRGGREVDRAVEHVLRHAGQPHEIRDFEPWGDDERQYGAPAFDLPVGALSRTPYGGRPEYHSSADDLGLVSAEALAASLGTCLEIVDLLESNVSYVNRSPHGEPRLAARGLHGSPFGAGEDAAQQRALLWVLNLSDGRHSLLDVAERAALPFRIVSDAAQRLQSAGLLRVREPLRGLGAA